MDKHTKAKSQDMTAVAGQVEFVVRPVPEANCGNMRRVIRAARLCQELGHPGDTLAALEELKELRIRQEKWHSRAVALRSVLRVIVEQDPIELALDPQWSQRIAKGGLDATQEA